MKNNNKAQLKAGKIVAFLSGGLLSVSAVFAQQPSEMFTLKEVVVSASRSEQRQFDAPAAVNAIPLDTFHVMSPLVNISEVLGGVPGLQVRERQNYAQDLQLSVRGFGTRSTFGVRGVRILVDGIPATMPDGQGQAATASLTSARRIEVLRGPVAQLYGNAAGGVLQVFTKEPSVTEGRPVISASAAAGSYGQQHVNVSLDGGTEKLGALLDVSRYSTNGYRDHSAAERTHANAKVVLKLSQATRVTASLNSFNQPEAQDPLGLTHGDFMEDPRQVIPNALTFNTRKRIEQHQGGIVIDHRLSAHDSLHARLYMGTRRVDQKLAFMTNGVVDLDRTYGGVGIHWTHKARLNELPLRWTLGFEADQLNETRKGFDNVGGTNGALRRNEDDTAKNRDAFGQVEWRFAKNWKALAGIRFSQVSLNVDDRFNPSSTSTSGKVKYHSTSPVVGMVWHKNEHINIYGNIGRGFETPTLAEMAYRPDNAPGPNFTLQPSKSIQAEIGVKLRRNHHEVEGALFDARSRDEIASQSTSGGRTVFQNVDRVQRRGIEAFWKAAWNESLTTRLSYTLLDAQFKTAFSNAQGAVSSGNRLPGAPRHSVFAEAEGTVGNAMKLALEMRADGKVYVNDANDDTAPGYAVFNARLSKEFQAGTAKLLVYMRLDNLLNRHYAGSVIVNEGNRRFFEAAPERRIWVGLRSTF